MGTNGSEENEDLVVDGSCDIQQGAENALYAPDTLVIDWRAVFVFGDILRFSTVNNGAMFVRGQLGFLGGQATLPKKDVLYVTVHCEAARADTGLVVPR